MLRKSPIISERSIRFSQVNFKCSKVPPLRTSFHKNGVRVSYVKIYLFKTGYVYQGIRNTSITAIKIVKKRFLKYALSYQELIVLKVS